jgi:hypothetical protein
LFYIHVEVSYWGRGKERVRGKGGVMTQSLYAHMNNGNFKKKLVTDT